MKRNPHDWERIQRIGLRPEITAPEHYEAAVARGLLLAKDFLVASRAFVPSTQQIQLAHKATFGSVHSWAGDFRTVEVMAGATLCTPPSQIASDLKRLESFGKEAFSSKEPYKRLKAIAFYHATFEEIHPFLDGNGRIGRSIISAQLALSFRQAVALQMPRAEYIHAIMTAQREFDFTPLAELIGQELSYARELHSEIERNPKIGLSK